jgi:hypothetical protein
LVNPAAAAAAPGAAPFSDETPDNDFRRFCRRAWARFIKKIYLADPLTCPKCGGHLPILSFIDDPRVIEKILPHPRLWEPQDRSQSL